MVNTVTGLWSLALLQDIFMFREGADHTAESTGLSKSLLAACHEVLFLTLGVM